jgi:hypothetical protein
MSARRWLADCAFDLACWLEPPAAGGTKALAAPSAGVRYAVRPPAPNVSPKAPHTARMLRRVADDVETGVVRHFALSWPDRDGDTVGTVSFGRKAGDA